MVKLLIKPPETDIDMRGYLDKLNELRSQLKDIPNTLPFDTLIDSERATYLVRPYVRYNLYDRLSIRPFFESIEKKWIVYQLLVTLSKMHEKGICHGDLKTENVLLTSWNWIMLADIGLFKPVYLPDQNQSQFSFYFDTIQRHSCYVAPERFKSQAEIDELLQNPDNVKLNPETDIFSLGCVIAELYTDGLPIFSLPQMFRYRKGQYTPNLDAIEDSNIRKLIRSMISLDPKERLSAKEYLVNFRKVLFPDFFYTFLYAYVKNLSTHSPSSSDIFSEFQICDYRIDRLYQDFDKISLYLGFKRNIIETDENNTQKKNEPGLIPIELNLPGMNKHIPQNTSAIFKEGSINDCSSLILLSILCHNVRNTTHSSYRIKACDLILALGEQLHDEAKFDRCLPYLINMLDDPSESVQISALCCMTELLMMIDTITPINVHVFTEYIVPKLQLFLKRSYMTIRKESSNMVASPSKITDRAQPQSAFSPKNSESLNGSYVRMVFACCLPYLAMTSKKFYELSVLLKNRVGTYHDPDIDSIIFNDRDRNEFEYAEIVQNFEHLTIQILTDSNIYVRIALMRNIQPLCSFFGKDKTNDVILSHLITYLNDKNPQIKLAFVSSIVPLSIFVGVTSLEQYILPLLVQALYGPEETIVITLLKVLAELINLGLVRKECFWDLVNLSIVLILHPNGLIRQSVLNLIIIIGNQLSMSDFYCMLYPLIRPFFQHEVTSFTWENLYIAAHSPISRAVFNNLTIWSLSTHDSLFWQRLFTDSGPKAVDMFGNAKLLFAKKKSLNGSISSNNGAKSNSDDFVANFEVPLSSSDLKHIEKLKNLGLKSDELWKVASLRSYIYKVSRLSMRSSRCSAGADLTKLIPRSVFVDVSHRYEFGDQVKDFKAFETSQEDSKKLSPPSKNKEGRENGGPLILRNLQTPKPVVTTSDRTAFGESSNSFLKRDNTLFEDFGDANVYDESTQLKKLSTDVSFSYPGKNPFILKFLHSLEFEPDLKDYHEFGRLVDTTNIEGIEPATENPKNCVLISRLIEHQASIVDIVAAPDNEYFISADSLGVLKIWESKRLEIDVTGESCLSVNMGSPIKSLCMMKDRHCFAVSREDGSVNIFRVDFVSSLENSRLKVYQKTSITLIKHFKMRSADYFASNLCFNITRNKPYLFMVTPTAKLIGIDIRDMKEIFSFQNNIIHGSIQALVVDETQTWAVIGTNKGIIDLWDLDAGLCVKSTKFKHSSYGITKMIEVNNVLSSSKNSEKFICFVGGTGDSDVVIWDVERAQPRIVLCSNSKQSFSTVELYSVCEVKDEVEDEILDMYINKKLVENDNGCTSVAYSTFNNRDKPGKIVCALHNRKIIEWDLGRFETSRVVVDVRGKEGHVGDYPVYSETQVNSTLTFVHERYISSKNKDTTASNRIGSGPKVVNKAPCDTVTSLLYLRVPYKMVVCGDQSGAISIYR